MSPTPTELLMLIVEDAVTGELAAVMRGEYLEEVYRGVGFRAACSVERQLFENGIELIRRPRP